ncbi:MAG: hypothetical protein LBB59_04080 [Campylobacteraceae bacterium]|jgi:hypothetical protein|nr:hypothetical protein [Campylobacteraceae bacterium]
MNFSELSNLSDFQKKCFDELDNIASKNNLIIKNCHADGISETYLVMEVLCGDTCAKIWIYTDECEFSYNRASYHFEKYDFDSADELINSFIQCVLSAIKGIELTQKNSMIKCIWLDYKNFEYSKDIIIYTEYIDADEKVSIYAKNIAIWVETLIYKLEKCKYKIYSINRQQEVSFKTLTQKEFLFYSVKNALEYQEFFITADDIDMKNYKNINELLTNKNFNGVAMSNDCNGFGLYFFINDNYVEYNWIVEYLKPYNPDIFNYSAQEEKWSFKTAIMAVVIAPLLVVLGILWIIIAILDILDKPINPKTAIEAITKIFKKQAKL